MCESKDSTVSVEYFSGCLLGALLGDCLGGPFEGEDTCPDEVQMYFDVKAGETRGMLEFSIFKEPFLVHTYMSVLTGIFIL